MLSNLNRSQMKKIPEVFSSDNLAVSVPASWSELTPKQMILICQLFAADLFTDAFDTILFFKLAGIKFIGRNDDAKFIVKKDKKIYLLNPTVGYAADQSLKWVHEVADINHIAGLGRMIHKSAFDDRLENASLAEFIAADASYTGYVSTQKPELADNLINILCPKINKIKSWHRPAAVIWFSALKKYLSDRFSFLFSERSEEKIFGNNSVSPASVRDSADAMIRALSKGDITIEEKVLECNLYRALTELNQLAKEYQELKKI